ncbi:uncharacterized protein KQ657_000186 [Scheffersomyces spartinae]|uniref:Replication termination factor 2 n=1 Tax=Scheffersomyces spartinae TaxID=45513 RepID=A0A9P8ALK2_9ASCO|nr:uncharacterized protein KQ657_000186 [Scheffersomyces spartinae]KAG7196174.1 hypothetical protein KQ657_000186 [Scheffersomyces spartinae]
MVSDYKGKLYLKEKILEYLLALARTKKETSLESDTTKPAKNDMAHIKGLQDLVDLKISWDPLTSQIECPVTGTTNKSLCYLRSCGCVMSYAFINELSNKNSVPTFPCPLCEKPFNREYDMVVLNPLSDTHLMGVNNDSYEKLKAQHLSHSKRSLKKSKKTKSKIGSGAQESLDTKKRSSSESCASTTKKQRV